MILDANNKDHHRYRIFDANGVKLDLNYVTMVDTDTGAITRIVFNDDGKCKTDEYGNFITETTTVPAPLIVTV